MDVDYKQSGSLEKQSPDFEHILGPEGRYVHVGKTGGQFVHYYDEELDKDVTLHIGATETGKLVCDSREKEYTRPHRFLGNIAIGDVPVDVLRHALRQSVSDTRFLFHKGRQTLIKALAAHIPEVSRIDIYLPEPVTPEEFGNDPEGARICLSNLRSVLDSIFDIPASYLYVKKRL